jgi:hypothetical protein
MIGISRSSHDSGRRTYQPQPRRQFKRFGIVNLLDGVFLLVVLESANVGFAGNHRRIAGKQVELL